MEKGHIFLKLTLLKIPSLGWAQGLPSSGLGSSSLRKGSAFLPALSNPCLFRGFFGQGVALVQVPGLQLPWNL